MSRPVDPTGRLPLRVHARYSRDEACAAFGIADPSTVREGMKWVPDEAADLFFVTLTKTEQHYSPTTMYADRAITPELFQWESQSTTSTASPTGQRYVHHVERGSSMHLFVREPKESDGDLGAPAYLYSGPMTVADRRLLGPGWSSRLLQAVLVDVLTNPATAAQIEDARKEYGRRRSALLAALAARNVTATGADGINLWLNVADQQRAMLTLAAHGVAVAPRAPFEVTPLGHDHIRVTVGLVRDGFEELADLLAEAAGTARPGSGRRSHVHPRGGR